MIYKYIECAAVLIAIFACSGIIYYLLAERERWKLWREIDEYKKGGRL